jgi:hypothetical protein
LLKVFLGASGAERARVEFRQGGLRQIKFFEVGEVRDQGVANAEVANDPLVSSKTLLSGVAINPTASALTARSKSSPSSPAMQPAVASKAARRRSWLLGLRAWT